MKITTRAFGIAGATMTLVGAGLVGAGSASAADTGIPVLEAIKQCESGGDYSAQNPTSTASGAYQFLDSTWQGMDAAVGYARAIDAPESVQDAAAIELYTEAGTSPWLASASCWQGQGFDVSNGSGESSTAAAPVDTGTTASTTAGDAGDTSAEQSGTRRQDAGSEGSRLRGPRDGGQGAQGGPGAQATADSSSAGRGGGPTGSCSR